MHRRTLGRGRRIAVLGAVVVVAGCLIPWYSIGGDGSGIPARHVGALDELAGLLVFLAALGIPAIVALPYAAGDRPVGADRWPSYALLLLVAAAGVVSTILSIVGGDLLLEGFRPDRAGGIWISSLGILVLARGVFEISQERR